MTKAHAQPPPAALPAGIDGSFRALVDAAPDAAAEAWSAWIGAHRDVLFFSESGGYRWYVDPLAKRRGVPTAKLRGPARADAAR